MDDAELFEGDDRCVTSNIGLSGTGVKSLPANRLCGPGNSVGCSVSILEMRECKEWVREDRDS